MSQTAAGSSSATMETEPIPQSRSMKRSVEAYNEFSPAPDPILVAKICGILQQFTSKNKKKLL